MNKTDSEIADELIDRVVGRNDLNAIYQRAKRAGIWILDIEYSEERATELSSKIDALIAEQEKNSSPI